MMTQTTDKRRRGRKPRGPMTPADERSPRYRLARLREARGWSRQQMAETLNMRWDTYRRYEVPLERSYASTPTLRQAVAIRHLSCELGDEIDPEDWVDEQDEFRGPSRQGQGARPKRKY